MKYSIPTWEYQSQSLLHFHHANHNRRLLQRIDFFGSYNTHALTHHPIAFYYCSKRKSREEKSNGTLHLERTIFQTFRSAHHNNGCVVDRLINKLISFWVSSIDFAFLWESTQEMCVIKENLRLFSHNNFALARETLAEK